MWVTLEWWRSWFLTGFNWNELGITQATSIVYRQLAAFGGVHLISFVLVMVNILWAEGVLGIVKTFQEKRIVRASLPFAAALFIVAAAFALGWHHLQRHRDEMPSSGFSFACIQPNIPQIPYNSERRFSSSARTQALEIDGESFRSGPSSTSPISSSGPKRSSMKASFRTGRSMRRCTTSALAFDGSFLLGSQDFDIEGGRKLYNCAYFFTPHGEQYDEYRKTRLVMLGEYLALQGIPSLRHAIGVGPLDFTPGPGPENFVMENPRLSFAPLICFEDTLPEVGDKAAQLQPDFFITITNDGWYQGWCAAWGMRQHLNHAIFRCIEHDRPMIRCANTGISCVIDQNGTVTDRFLSDSGAEIDVGGIFARKLEFYPAQGTLYESWGDWIVLISALVSVMLGVRLLPRSQAI